MSTSRSNMFEGRYEVPCESVNQSSASEPLNLACRQVDSPVATWMKNTKRRCTAIFISLKETFKFKYYCPCTNTGIFLWKQTKTSNISLREASELFPHQRLYKKTVNALTSELSHFLLLFIAALPFSSLS